MESHRDVQRKEAWREPLVVINIAQPTSPQAARLARALRNKEKVLLSFGMELGVEYSQKLEGEHVRRAAIIWARETEQTVQEVKHLLEAHPDTNVVVLSQREDPSLAWAILKAGANGYIHTSMDENEMAHAVVLAAQGELVVPRALIARLLIGEKPPDLSALSARQREVLDLALEGLSNRQIAKRLYLTESTIKQHLRGAYKVLGAKNRRDAQKVVLKAREWESGR